MTEQKIKMLKERYPAGTRVELDRMGDDSNPIPSGSKGTVSFVDDIGTVMVNFDNGRCLGICPEVDSFHKITKQDEIFEPTMSM